jgi:hypothetical protein
MHSKIPIVERWWKVHGMKTTGGRLRAATDSDYFVFTCPGCKAELRGGAGIKLLGVSDDLNAEAEHKHVLAFLLHCTLCGLVDHFKIAVDQFGRYGTGLGIEEQSDE